MTKFSRATAFFALAILISGFLGGAGFAVSRNGNLEYWQKQTIPVNLTKLNFQPYISEEWFVHLGENNIDQNRLIAGVSWPITKNLKSSLYYMWKAGRSKTGGWGNTNVIGTDFKFPF